MSVKGCGVTVVLARILAAVISLIGGGTGPTLVQSPMINVLRFWSAREVRISNCWRGRF